LPCASAIAASCGLTYTRLTRSLSIPSCSRVFSAAETLLEQLPDYTLPPQMLERTRVELLQHGMCWVSQRSVTLGLRVAR
jgi:hypothetical protein